MTTNLADEGTQLSRRQSVVHPRKYGDGDYHVAENTPQVVKGVHPDCVEEGNIRGECEEIRDSKIKTERGAEEKSPALVIYGL